jgi:exosortase F-associated protein
MNKIARFSFIVALFLMLVAIRAIAIAYFYDPLISYFKNGRLHMSLPEIDFGKYSLFLFLRYSLNAIVSLSIIYVFFSNLKVLIFAVKFYVIAFVILGAILLIFLKFDVIESYLPTFYLRRFLIHPLFLLILLPAFYYQKLKHN